MRGYERYIEDVKSGKIATGLYIRQAVDRFLAFRNRPDVFFDADVVDNAEFFEEFRIVDVLVECRFKVVERAADDFGNVLAAELVKETVV